MLSIVDQKGNLLETAKIQQSQNFISEYNLNHNINSSILASNETKILKLIKERGLSNTISSNLQHKQSYDENISNIKKMKQP